MLRQIVESGEVSAKHFIRSQKNFSTPEKKLNAEANPCGRSSAILSSQCAKKLKIISSTHRPDQRPLAQLSLGLI
ncbi:MAG: hypothetical protein DMF76_00625 [Acidobacteria bacterium]|nr:MAG: hypothetical protein DMF76_00625 [Acidobacteriota bacterium]